MPHNVPVRLNVALFPVSEIIPAGHRLRLTINNADKDCWLTPEISPAPEVTILRDREHPSSITLPVIKK